MAEQKITNRVTVEVMKGMDGESSEPKFISYIFFGCFFMFVWLLLMLVAFVLGLGYLIYINPTAGISLMIFFLIIFLISKVGGDNDEP